MTLMLAKKVWKLDYLMYNKNYFKTVSDWKNRSETIVS